MTLLEHTPLKGKSASEIAASCERAILSGDLAPGESLPTVRGLAHRLRVSPATVASAYRDLKRQGFVEGEGRQGTRVAHRPPVTFRPEPRVPEGVRDLVNGHPDPTLLPTLGPLEGQAKQAAGNYEVAGNDPGLVAVAVRQFADDGIPADHLAVTSGALDGVERVLAAHLRPGDRVGVEDPAFPPLFDLLRALGLRIEPIAIDDFGPRPDAVEQAVAKGLDALIVTPRAQNPTGAALDAERATQLRRLLRRAPDLLVIEDDHAAAVAGVDAETLWQRGRRRWAVVRSVAKALGPDLRLAVAAGDEVTIGRVAGRQALGPGWVSTVLQRLVADLWADRATQRVVERATREYAARRRAAVTSLSAHGVDAHARSGMNAWIPVPEEASVVAGLRDAGWAVAAGERFRLKSPPAIRITVATMTEAETREFAADLGRLLHAPPNARKWINR